jgi:fructose-bisphosphate aldolase class II
MENKLLTDALKNNYAVGAFNFSNLEVLKAIIVAAENQNSPVICQVSEGAMAFIGENFLKDFIKTSRKSCKVPVCFHLDHGKSFESVVKAIKAGCDSVMIDASMLPFDDNVKITKKVVDYAHKHNVTVEAELGSLAGIEEDLNVADKDKLFTDPKQAKEFVKKTGTDSLAVSIGTKHGAYKFSGDARLRFDILDEIQKQIPTVPLVLHGASGVESTDVARLLELGVDIQGAKGVSQEILHKASQTHICKINGDTDLRIAFLIGILDNVEKNNKNIDYRKYLAEGMNQVSNLVAHKMEVYESKNKADNFKTTK